MVTLYGFFAMQTLVVMLLLQRVFVKSASHSFMIFRVLFSFMSIHVVGLLSPLNF